MNSALQSSAVFRLKQSWNPSQSPDFDPIANLTGCQQNFKQYRTVSAEEENGKERKNENKGESRKV